MQEMLHNRCFYKELKPVPGRQGRHLRRIRHFICLQLSTLRSALPSAKSWLFRPLAMQSLSTWQMELKIQMRRLPWP